MDEPVATTLATIQQTIVTLAGTVQDNALAMIANILPVLALVVAAIIVANLGVRLVKRFSA